MAFQKPEIHVGDVVALKKQHPCGSNVWRILRVGMDVKLECTGCGRQVMLKRGEFERRYKAHVQIAGGNPGDPHGAMAPRNVAGAPVGKAFDNPAGARGARGGRIGKAGKAGKNPDDPAGRNPGKNRRRGGFGGDPR